MSDDFLEENSKTEAREKGRRNTSYGIVGSIAAFALIGWFANLYFASMYDWGDRSKGEFGDIFGVINSLFTGLAFIGVVWSVYNQQEELRETKRQTRIAKLDLKRTQDILAKQEENITAQNAATTKQMFEATFFQMFSAFSQVTKEIEVRWEEKRDFDFERQLRTKSELEEYSRSLDKVANGREAFEALVKLFHNKFDMHIKHRNKEDPQGLEDVMDDETGFWIVSEDRRDLVFRRAYLSLFRDYGDDIGRYFRILHTIMSFVQNADIPDKDRKTYIKFVRAQLSIHEATMLMLNYLSPYTSEKFNKLCRLYGMGKNADWNDQILQQMDYRLPNRLRGQPMEKR